MKFNSPIQFCISCWKVAGTLQSPKGIYCTQRTPGYPWWRQYTSLMPQPSFSAKIQISGPGRKSGQHLLSSLVLLVFGVRGRNPSLYGHSGIRSQCQNVSHHLSSSLVLWHYTRHRGLFLEGLGVGGVVLHHHYHLLATLPQFSICILHGKARWQGAILGMQSLHHHVKTFSQVCLHCLHGDYMGGKRFQCLYLLCIH